MAHDPRRASRSFDHGPRRLGELRRGDLRLVRLQHARLGLHDLSQRPERIALAVRKGASLPPANQLGAADRRSGRARGRAGSCRSPGAPTSVSDCGERCSRRERSNASDSSALARRGRRAASRLARVTRSHPGARLERLPARDRLGLALHRDRVELLVVDRRAGRAVRQLADEHAVDRRGRLQPGRGIDDVARRDVLARGGRASSETSASPVLTPMRTWSEPGRLVRLGEGLADRERRPNGALGVVLVRRGRAEHRHDARRR